MTLGCRRMGREPSLFGRGRVVATAPSPEKINLGTRFGSVAVRSRGGKGAAKMRRWKKGNEQRGETLGHLPLATRKEAPDRRNRVRIGKEAPAPIKKKWTEARKGKRSRILDWGRGKTSGEGQRSYRGRVETFFLDRRGATNILKREVNQ